MATTFRLGFVMIAVAAQNQIFTGEGGPCGVISRNQKRLKERQCDHKLNQKTPHQVKRHCKEWRWQDTL